MLNCVLNLLLTQHFASTRDLVQPPLGPYMSRARFAQNVFLLVRKMM